MTDRALGMAAVVFVVSLAGCNLDIDPESLDKLGAVCELARLAAPTADELMPQLEAALASPASAESTATDHLLADVPVGVGVDDISGLDGCWVSYRRGAIGTSTSLAVTVLEVDMTEQRIIEYDYFRWPQTGLNLVDPLYEAMGNPAAVAWFWNHVKALTVLNETAFLADPEGVFEYNIGAVDTDNNIIFDCAAVLPAEMDATDTLAARFTLDGDYLKLAWTLWWEDSTLDDLPDPEEVQASPDWARYFVRMDCVSP